MIRRVKSSRLLILTLSLLLSATAGWAFELDTHRDITRAAFGRSKVADTLHNLGIDPVRRLSAGFLRGSDPPVGWLVEGVRDEDAFVSAEPTRFRHHFYDPVNDRGLTTSQTSGERAPDWALEDRQEFPSQAFSYRDARREFLTALTASVPGDREAALAGTFEILGHVIHLVQDMASPPHTRNDSHGGFIFGQSSLYEHHLNQPPVLERLNLNGTPVRFDLPRHYWTTGDGRGLAEFVNQNFVSEGTNFGARRDGAIGGGYPSPVLRLGTDEQGRPFETTLDIQTQLEPGLRDRNSNLIEGSVTFFANNFRDPITGRALRNERMTTLSLFDRELERRGEPLVFTLNRYNVEAQAAFLIPRAVGYSAGLLDYFFRGSLDFHVKASAAGATRGEFTITNTSSEAMIGDFTLYAEDANAIRTPVAPPFSLSLSRGATSAPLTFPAPAQVQAYVLVFRGRLGSEDGAVAAKRKRATVNGFFVWQVHFQNDQSDLVDLFTGFTGACFIPFVESLTSAGTHTGSQAVYLFFAFVDDPNLSFSPLDVSQLQATARLSPEGTGGGALGFIRGAGGQTCGSQSFPYALYITPVFRSPETNRYVLREDSRVLDTGVLGSADILLTHKVTQISLEELQAIAKGLHLLLTPPPSFPRTATVYAVAQFNIPNRDSFAVSDSNKAFWGDRTAIASATVAEMWSLASLTLHVSDGTDIRIPAVHQRFKRLDFSAVYGTEYLATVRTNFDSFTLRHNPNDPFNPIRE